MLRALIRLDNAILLMLESWRFSIGIIIFCYTYLRRSFLSSIVFEEIFSPVSELTIKKLLFSVDMFDEISSLMALPIKEVGRLSYL